MLDVMLQVYVNMSLCWMLCYRCMQTCNYVRCYVTGVCRHVIMLDIMLQVYADM